MKKIMSFDETLRAHLQMLKDEGHIGNFVFGQKLENGMFEIYVAPVTYEERQQTNPKSKDIQVCMDDPQADFIDPIVYYGQEIDQIPRCLTSNTKTIVKYYFDPIDAYGYYVVYFPDGSSWEVGHFLEEDRVKLTKLGYTLFWGKNQPHAKMPKNLLVEEIVDQLGPINTTKRKSIFI